MPGTCSATRVEAFSVGSSSPYDELVSAPLWADTMITSQPRRLISGTYFEACSTSPGNSIRPSTLALSQIAMPGLVRPRMPTLMRGPCRGLNVLTTYGGKTGRLVCASTALAPRRGKLSCSS